MSGKLNVVVYGVKEDELQQAEIVNFNLKQRFVIKDGFLNSMQTTLYEFGIGFITQKVIL